MIININGQTYEFSKDELNYMYEDEGNESIIYRYKDKALKIYKAYSRKDRLTKLSVDKLSKIKTKRILMPESIIHNKEGQFLGYTLKYIERYQKSLIQDLNIDKFIEEMKLISDDIEILSDNNIDIDDLIIENTLYDGNIYITDPGSYIFNYHSDQSKIRKDNKIKFNEFVIKELMTYKINLTKKSKQKFINHFYLDSENVIDVICEEKTSKDTVKTYVKKVVK